jgi:lytic murein transglycosylase
MHRSNAGATLLASLLIAAAPPGARADDFPRCIGEVRAQAAAGGITAATFDKALAGIEPDPEVIEAMDRQPEFMLSIWEYLARLVSDKRIADGKRMLVEWAGVLDDVERAFGVERHIVVAVWGVESNYGTILGTRPLVRSLATASCFGRRQPFFRSELIETLRIAQKGEIRAEDLKGSWAGAFGHTQFMPSTFQRLAIDFDADGRRDIVNSVPDALASTANYLRKAGWEPGKPWGQEVVLPRGYAGPSGRRTRLPLSKWDELGIQRFGERPLTGDTPAALLLPAGVHGPAFIVFANFDALYSYNAAESYALAIAHLADRLRGGRSFRAAWPVDDPALSRTQRIEVQERLASLGYDVGSADGIIGGRTVEAIKAFQRSRGLQPDGYAGVRLHRALTSVAVRAAASEAGEKAGNADGRR